MSISLMLISLKMFCRLFAAVLQGLGVFQMGDSNYIPAFAHMMTYYTDRARRMGYLCSLSAEKHFYRLWPMCQGLAGAVIDSLSRLFGFYLLRSLPAMALAPLSCALLEMPLMNLRHRLRHKGVTQPA